MACQNFGRGGEAGITPSVQKREQYPPQHIEILEHSAARNGWMFCLQEFSGFRPNGPGAALFALCPTTPATQVNGIRKRRDALVFGLGLRMGKSFQTALEPTVLRAAGRGLQDEVTSTMIACPRAIELVSADSVNARINPEQSCKHHIRGGGTFFLSYLLSGDSAGNCG